MIVLASTATLVVVNLVFGAIALAVGFAAGAWVCGGSEKPSQDSDPIPTDTSNDQQELQIERDRTAMAGERLRDLAASVLSDVGEHNASIERIETELAASRGEGGVSEDAIVEAMRRITSANRDLQAKLAKAEQQIQSQAEAIRAHESEARTDALTGLANRRAFDDELKRRFAEWTRKGTEFSLLIMDVDFFKKFNDTHGHQAGDEVLRAVGRVLGECARDMDMPCRYGGEEFAIVLPATPARDSGIVAERVRKRIEAMAIPFEGKTLRVTTSVGLAGVTAEDDATSIIKRADAALYRSKDAGRNNSHFHDGVTIAPVLGTPRPPAPIEPTADAAPAEALDALPNRTRFVEELRVAVRAHKDSGAPLAIAIAELRGYRTLADEFGPAVARLTIDSIAQFLDHSLREQDLLGRLEDGRFAVLMPGYREAEARTVTQRIGEALANCTVPIGETALSLETAIQVAELTGDDSAVTLMERAERSLHGEVASGMLEHSA